MKTLEIAAARRIRTDAGLFCYLMTPYDARGDVDTGMLREYATSMIDAGVDGLTCLASTCEGAYLTERERHLVTKVVAEAARGKAHVNAGVGAVSTRQTIEYAKQAEDAGATSLMIDMPTFFPLTFDQAYSHYETIALSVGLPIRLYNIPIGTGYDFTPDQLAKLAPIATINSIKEASGDVTRIRDIKNLCGDRFQVFCGFHFMALDAYNLGADGWEAGIHPLVAAQHVALYQALYVRRDLDTGRELFERLEPLFGFFKFYGVTQSIKAMSQWTDLKLGLPRQPLTELPPTATTRLAEILRNLDVM